MLRAVSRSRLVTIGASSNSPGVPLRDCFPRSGRAVSRAASAIDERRWRGDRAIGGSGAVAAREVDGAQPCHSPALPSCHRQRRVDWAAALTTAGGGAAAGACAAATTPGRWSSSHRWSSSSSHMAVAHPSLGSTRLARVLRLSSPPRTPRVDESARLFASSSSCERALCRHVTNGAASSHVRAGAANIALPSSGSSSRALQTPPNPVRTAPTTATALPPVTHFVDCRRRRCRACGGPRTGSRHVTRKTSPGPNFLGDATSGSLLRKVSTTAAAAITSDGQGSTIVREDVVREDDPTNNVSDAIFTRLGMQLHNRPNHPLSILKNVIYDYFDKRFPMAFNKFENLSPIVSTEMNFDEVLVPADHVSRSYNDTYYIDKDTVLRCHTSAHQAEMLRAGNTHFLVTGDVYRRDSIDATHYPVFHQMEGVRVFSRVDWEAAGMDGMALAEKDLKETLEGLAQKLFGTVEMRWVDTYFPFTEPSFELEIFFQGEWLEVLGCGVMEQQILTNCGRPDDKAWAFGLGLERLAMVLFQIPDIRLFWTDDKRFTSQFKEGQMDVKFKTYSKYPPCFKDISFWISDAFTENNLCEVVRAAAGDLAEEVKLIDEFTNKKGMTSHCYRIAYRSMDRSLTDEEINRIQETVRQEVEKKLKVTLR